jgi:hypothetical protein
LKSSKYRIFIAGSPSDLFGIGAPVPQGHWPTAYQF